MSKLTYALVTPARNEEKFIEQTIQSVIAQTVLPRRWVIVDDGSTDRTGEIVKSYIDRYEWMELVTMPHHRDRSFAAKAYSFRAGYERVQGIAVDIVANLDADITFESDYIEFLLEQFAADPRLGVAGTIFKEDGYSSDTDSFEGGTHVAGGCQMFRRACFEEIGGYAPTKIGVDWIAVTTARMRGWTTRSFREKSFFHHRTLGTGGRSRIGAAFLYGEKDFRLGWHPLYELCRMAFQVKKNPLVGFGVTAGYVCALVTRVDRAVSPDLMRFHRAEQMAKLKSILRRILAFERVDSFHVGAR